MQMGNDLTTVHSLHKQESASVVLKLLPADAVLTISSNKSNGHIARSTCY